MSTPRLLLLRELMRERYGPRPPVWELRAEPTPRPPAHTTRPARPTPTGDLDTPGVVAIRRRILLDALDGAYAAAAQRRTRLFEGERTAAA